MTDVGDAPSASPCLALDIGGTKVDAAIMASNGSVVRRDRLNVAAHGPDLFDVIVTLVRRVIGGDDVRVGCAGPMTRGGATVSPLNILFWREFPLRQSLRDALGIDVYVEGDARAVALAEGEYGAARDVTSYLSMVVATGMGGVIVLNGRLLDGETGNADHVGHFTFVTNGALCSCGAYGCLEAEASGCAIEGRTGRPASEAVQATRLRTGELVGRVVGMLSSVLDFCTSYVAGSATLGFVVDFFAAATKAARETAKRWYSHDLEIVPSQLGTNGPLLGPALVGWRGAS